MPLSARQAVTSLGLNKIYKLMGNHSEHCCSHLRNGERQPALVSQTGLWDTQAGLVNTGPVPRWGGPQVSAVFRCQAGLWGSVWAWPRGLCLEKSRQPEPPATAPFPGPRRSAGGLFVPSTDTHRTLLFVNSFNTQEYLLCAGPWQGTGRQQSREATQRTYMLEGDESHGEGIG